jgi:glyoxylase-like metal-dependent hydrolase (beta-lactamase superfamily II)
MQIHTLRLPLANAYLLENEAGLYLVDAGAPGDADRIQRRMNQIGRSDLKLIFLTHAHLDHFGAAAELRRRTGAPVAIHSDDAQALAEAETMLGEVRGRGRLIGALLPLLERVLPPEPVQADILVSDGQSLAEFGLEARVLHTPGHTPGSSCLMVEGELAFAGDLVSSTGKPHPQRFFAGSWTQVAQSLERLQSAGPRLSYPGHGNRSLTGEEVAALRLDWLAQDSS